MSKQSSAPQKPKEVNEQPVSEPKAKGVLIKKTSAQKRASQTAIPLQTSAAPSVLSAPSPTVHLTDGDLSARIAQRAYEIFHRRGGHHGQDLDDWFRAEQEVLTEHTP